MSNRYQGGINRPGYNPLKVANAPTIGTATVASGTTVSVTFTAPSCVGGGAITSYTAFACCGIKLASGSSSPLVVSCLTTGTTYTFKVIATNAYGPSYPSAASNSATPLVIGQQAYTTGGTFSWVAPSGVTSVSVVAVGGGGFAGPGGNPNSAGGGGLGYKNNYSVTPGSSYTVVVPAKASPCASGGDAYFVSTSVVKGGGGSGGGGRTGGTYTGDGGGNGGNGGLGNTCIDWSGGGGAGGYSGNGGAGGCASSPNRYGRAGSGGGGGGGYGANKGGGGVGILGQGTSGAQQCSNATGNPGSGGTRLTYGGGGARGGNGGGGACCNWPSVGAVRIIWPGTTRQFPSTCTGDL